MRIALVGVRGVPALYSGFETAATEICSRLVKRGHKVTVYCRRGYGDERELTYLGIRKKYLSSLPISFAETLSHTLLAILDATFDPPDVLIVFNPANSPFLILSRLRKIPTALNVDGLEWQRKKWPAVGRAYFYFACWLSTRIAPWIIADSRAIQRFYNERWGRDTYFATYGTYRLQSSDSSVICRYDLKPCEYFLVVARLEPENNPDLIVEAFQQIRTSFKLAIVGSTRYRSRFVERLKRSATDPRIRWLGGIYDAPVLEEILCNAFVYIHGHMVGGTNPILLQALGAGACVLYLDDPYGFNREVVGEAGLPYSRNVGSLASQIQKLLDNAAMVDSFKRLAQARVSANYSWDVVADQYEQLCELMKAQHSSRFAKG